MSDYLTPADLIKLYLAVFDARNQWRNILLVLEVSSDIIDSIGTKWRNNPDDCYREGLKEWLKGGEGSWEDVVKALSSPTVGHSDLARTIERDHVLQPTEDYLTIADLGDLYIATFDARIKWRNFLLVLEIPSYTIDSIGTKWRDDPDDCYREGLKEWLSNGERRWEDVVKALSSPIVDHSALARTIERDHLQSTTRDVKSEVDQTRQKINEDLTIFLDERLGKGAYGVVFKGSYKGKICAVKVLLHDTMEMQTSIPTGKSEEASRDFDRECDFLESLQHPNIVQYLSTTKHPKSGGTILVLELMDCNLRSYFSGLDEESLTSECEISLSKDIACGLAYIHSKKIIHRDLCGDNILLKLAQPLPVAKICDFGMSRLYDPSKFSSTLTAVGHRMGYLPLEAIRLNREKYDNSLDVFSLGAIMVQIVCKLKTIKSVEDRSFYVTQIPHTHRLRKLIDSCLQEDMTKRPTARDIYASLTGQRSKVTQPVNSSVDEQLKYVHKLKELLADTEKTINLRYLKLYLIGLSGLGKTTFRKRLLGHLRNLASIPPQDRERCSTLLAECNQVLAVSSDSKLIVKASTDIDNEAQLIFDYLIDFQQVLNAAISKVVESADPTNDPIIDSKTKEDSQVPQEGASRPAKLKAPETKIDKIIENLRDIVKRGNYKEQLVGTVLLNIIDIGGQPGFMEMLPLLSKGPGMFLAFFPLDKDLDELYEVSYKRDQDKITPYQAKYTIRETLSQILSAISHVDSDLHSEIADKVHSRDLQAVVSLVGTYQDKLEIQAKAEVVQAKLKGDYPGLDENTLGAAIQLILEVQQEVESEQKVEDIFFELEAEVGKQLELDSFSKDLVEHVEQIAKAKATTEKQQKPTTPQEDTELQVEVLEKTLPPEIKNKLKQSTPKAVQLLLQLKQCNETLSKIASAVVHQLSTASTIQADTEKCLQSKLQEKHEALSTITSHFGDIINHPDDSHFFSVDNFSGTDADIDPIREHLQTVFDSFFKAAELQIRPVQLLFGVILRKEFEIATMDECIQIGKALKMDEEEVKFTIWYLHQCVGALLYYPDIHDKESYFKNRVICSPNVVFNSIRLLIVESLLSLHSSDRKYRFTADEINNWQKFGHFSITTIKRCCSKSNKAKVREGELIPVDKLVKLLEHVSLLAPIVGKGRQPVYFMPAILKCASKEELSNAPAIDSNTPSPIKITFESGYVPIGVFCAMISKLVSEVQKGILGLKWNLRESRVMRNLVSFEVGSAKHYITLVAHADCYEIRLTRREDCDMHDLCSYVLTTVLYNVMSGISKKIRPIVAFDCQCPKHQNVEETSLCKLMEGRSPFFQCEDGRVILPPHQECWFGKEVKLNEEAVLVALPFADPDDLSFKWTRKGNKVAGGSDNELTVDKVTRDNCDGFYTCEVSKNKELCFKVHHCLKSISEATATGGDITLKTVKYATSDARTKWYHLAINLDVDERTIKSIEMSHNGRVDECFVAMLEAWFKKGSPSWSVMVEALRGPSVERGDLADVIEKEFILSLLPRSLTLTVISTVLQRVRAKWFELGVALGLPDETLQVIKKNHHATGDRARFTKMLEVWLQSSPNPTWSDLVEALRSPAINRPDIAAEIEDKYIKSDDSSVQESKDTAVSVEEQLKYVHKLNELLTDTENTINIRYLKLYLIGLSGLGKTTFRKRLLGQLLNLASIPPQDRKRCSTLLAECTQVLAVSSDSKLILKASTDIDNETQLIFAYMIGLQQVLRTAISKTVVKSADQLAPTNDPIDDLKLKEDSDIHPTDEVDPSKKHESKQPKEESDIHPTGEVDPSKKQGSKQPKSQGLETNVDKNENFKAQSAEASTKLVPRKRLSKPAKPKAPETKVDKIIENLRDVVKRGNYMEQLVGKALLNIIDIGGQPGFVEMLPFLSKGPGMFLAFFPLAKDLDEFYEISYERDQDKITPYQSTYTIRDTLSQILSAISHYVTVDSDLESEIADKVENFRDLQAVVSLVGTYQDNLEIQAKAEVVQAKLKGVYTSLDEITLGAAVQLILEVQQEVESEQKMKEIFSELEAEVGKQLELDSFSKNLVKHVEQKAKAKATTDKQQKPTTPQENTELESKVEVLEKTLPPEIKNRLKRSTPKAVQLSLQMKQCNETLSNLASAVVHQLSTDSTIQAETENHLQTKLKEKHKALSTITSNFGDVISSHLDGSHFFSVDNFNGTDADIDPIREHLQTVFDSRFKAAELRIRPVQLFFGVILRKEFEIAMMEECIKIGKELQMDEEEVKFTIRYLHQCVGALLYYPDIKDKESYFKNRVICSPNVVFNSISLLFVEPLLSLHSSDRKYRFTAAEIKKWQELGQFSIATIKLCCSKSNETKVKEGELIPVDKLVKLLEHVSLLAPITCKGRQPVYFMPAILECASKEELSNAPTIDSNTPSPIKITFESGYVPIGVFCAMISKLVSEGQKGILGLKWNLRESCVKRNLISFNVDSAKHHITLVAHADCYEIRITRKYGCDMHDLCSYVLTTVLYAMSGISKKIEPIIAFDCQCLKHQNAEGTSLCKLMEGHSLFFQCGDDRVSLLPHQECWFAKEVELNEKAVLDALPFANPGVTSLSFEWTKNSKMVADKSLLTVDKVTRDHCDGFYTCEVSKNKQFSFKVYHCLRFIIEATATGGDITLKTVKDATWNACAKWYHLAINLDVDEGTIKSIKKHYNTPGDCFTAMLEVWLQSSPNPTWSVLVETLRSPDINRPDIAAMIEDVYIKSDDSSLQENKDTAGSCAQPVSTALQQLMDKYHLTTSQINREIQQKNIPLLAVHFDNVEFYIYLLELTSGEQSDVRLKKTESNHLAMIECLAIWKRKKPSQATFRALLEMLVMLKKEGIAAEVCQCMKALSSL
ncbi:uncharacterized protein LOC135335598 isoform X4 [Halichondria panicea]|uniref:uncharacterized protein LOC135335598 isoform X4 n=1 Tax=Halichondria panicea TaxID=6063 RepID=UPI00312BAEA6